MIVEKNEAERNKMIHDILQEMKNQSILQNKPFDYGTIFIGLVFKEENELKKIASLLSIKY